MICNTHTKRRRKGERHRQAEKNSSFEQPSGDVSVKTFFAASTATTVLRDCAPQKLISYSYNEDKRDWDKTEEVITSAYNEGCFIGAHRGSPANPPEYCFCSFHLCNSSPTQTGMFDKIYETIAVLLIMILL
jgi:hypothetical protein